MVYTVHYFECGVCGSKYESWPEANDCERNHREDENDA